MLLWFKESIYWPLQKEFLETFFSPWSLLFLVLILFLEWRLPSKKGQKIFSVSFAQDLVWLFIDVLAQVFVMAAFVAFLKAAYTRHFDFLTIESLRSWDVTSRFVLAVLGIDFLAWLHHWVRHKVPWFWCFHTVHHSQKQLNLFTDMRYHFIEYMIAWVVKIVPMMMLSLSTAEIVWYAVAHKWYTRFYHAGIKTNMGPLKYVLVTPQSHRIHHSMRPEHRDKNFGVIFSVWDYAFGTQYKGYEEYPETGIHDERFPHERSFRGIFWVPVLQMIYPFKMIWNRLRKGASADA